MLGTPYVWGGNTPGSGLDCSGFLQQVYLRAGVHLPRTTYEQVKAGTAVSLKNLQPGDAVFTEPTANGPGHVGIYIGNGKVQESPHTGDVNKIISLKDFLGDGFVAARRYTNVKMPLQPRGADPTRVDPAAGATQASATAPAQAVSPAQLVPDQVNAQFQSDLSDLESAQPSSADTGVAQGPLVTQDQNLTGSVGSFGATPQAPYSLWQTISAGGNSSQDTQYLAQLASLSQNG